MLYILDTDHMTLWQHGNRTVIDNLLSVPIHERAVSQISLTEQLQGWQAMISRGRSEQEIARYMQRLYETVMFYQPLTVLPYDSAAIHHFERFRQVKIRIGSQDLRIASIAISKNAIVVTRNLRDFQQVPGIQVVDWSVS